MRSLALLSLVACTGGGSSGDPDQQVVQNSGRMCLHGDDPTLDFTEQVFMEDFPVFVKVQLVNECLSSSCDVDRSMTCSVDGLAVTSIARWTSLAATSQGCTDDCGIISAICETEPLAAGTHVVTFGGESIALTVPSTASEPPCVEAD